MRPELALDRAIDALAARSHRTVTIAQLVDELGGTGRGGGTREAARMLDISQRQVQRYITAGAQKRNAPLARVRGLSRAIVERRLAREGVRVVGAAGYVTVSDDTRRRTINANVEVPGAVLREAFTARDAAGDPELYGDVFGMGYLDAYGIGGGFFSDSDGDGRGADVSFFLLQFVEEED